MADFGCIRPFDIDNGELDGLPNKQCFVLGYALCMLDNLLEQGAEFTQLVHADNAQRVRKTCEDAGRMFKLEWMPGDSSETWLTLAVAAREGRNAQTRDR